MPSTPRIYPLSPRDLTEEQIAVAFAMTSRSPEPFDEIAKVVSAEKAADFNERWVLNYGHASVAEHAVLHMAVENVSRLAVDTLEDNRLASYTEKSSRYQVLDKGSYHVPTELDASPALRDNYVQACGALFDAYEGMVKGLTAYLRTVRPKGGKEREGTYALRLRREATDSARFLLPAATLTNVGVTLNARSMEHAIQKLASSDLAEERALGEALKEQGRTITPTLIKYADASPYLSETRQALRRASSPYTEPSNHSEIKAELVHYDPEAEAKVVAALLYRYAGQPYHQVWQQVQAMSLSERAAVLDEALGRLGPHDAPVRELEMADYTFDLLMDYGAYREYKRHRMQTYIPQPLTVEHGYLTPPLVQQAGLQGQFQRAIDVSERAFFALRAGSPLAAPYIVTHAHKRRVLAKLNLRECYHLFKLRTGPDAHFSLGDTEIGVVYEAMSKAMEAQPGLFKHLQLRRLAAG